MATLKKYKPPHSKRLSHEQYPPVRKLGHSKELKATVSLEKNFHQKTQQSFHRKTQHQGVFPSVSLENRVLEINQHGTGVLLLKNLGGWGVLKSDGPMNVKFGNLMISQQVQLECSVSENPGNWGVLKSDGPVNVKFGNHVICQQPAPPTEKLGIGPNGQSETLGSGPKIEVGISM
ncbi:hypothetical protein FIBSPDRAFT_903017 [Athelia psychrophila]|uniref:Uncharacterized protein n=1 Tax=Athelia psychrophila TaxID=1759441 RepID=A0A167WHQ1_9AGAM|nr:hypothetical protein FIBSPDRAFT_903017 [Fibularhizoctonia sp. CBS 109695]